jgi:hypothetical protein
MPDLNDTPVIPAPSRDELRQAERLPSGYKPLNGNFGFDPRLCFELALRMDPPDHVFQKYGYEGQAMIELAKNPTFQKVLKAYVDDINDNGLSFKAKARVAAEDLLIHAYEIATDPEQPTAVRADLIKWHAKVADLEPKTNAPVSGGNGFNLQIVFSGDAKQGPIAIEGERIKDVD